jgi:hypothetical protein
MKIEVSELKDAALDYCVAKLEIEGKAQEITFGYYGGGGVCVHVRPTNPLLEGHKMLMEPSSNWAQGGRIIDREGLTIAPSSTKNGVITEWKAGRDWPMSHHPFYLGPTPLIAAMRCFVASRMGNEVVLPEELA